VPRWQAVAGGAHLFSVTIRLQISGALTLRDWEPDRPGRHGNAHQRAPPNGGGAALEKMLHDVAVAKGG